MIDIELIDEIVKRAEEHQKQREKEFAITELEKIKAEAEELIELCDSDYEFEEIYGINSVVNIINSRIIELKGENNEIL